MKKRLFIIFLLIVLLNANYSIVLAIDTKFPNYSQEFLGKDTFETFNRKVFNFNLKVNNYALKQLHIIWSSIMPVYGMNRLQGITNNIEYPIRVVSCLIQRDFKTAKNETIRFLTNTTVGLGGMFDPAKRLFKLEQSNENMEQALAGCKMKSGQFMVLPILSFTCPRGILGKVLDMAFNPSSYIGTPILAIIKAGLTLNRTTYLQPWIQLIESTFADPYEIAKTIYGLDRYIKCNNFDRINVDKYLVKKDNSIKTATQEKDVATPNLVKSDKKSIVKVEVSSELVIPEILKGGANIDKTIESTENFKLTPNIILSNYNPQTPIVDSMRTALFDNPKVSKSMWNELSIWNHSFANRIKNSSVQVYPNRDPYKFRYYLQKNEQSPIAIIYPSIGEGIYSSHSNNLAYILYNQGYSVVIQGSNFQWEFLKSMPDGYKPGIAKNDAKELRLITIKILNQLEKQNNKQFEDKLIIGTSLGALESLFVANLEYIDNKLGKSNYIAICPPVELYYAMKQVDKISDDTRQLSDNLQNKVAQTVSKVVKLYNKKEENQDISIETLPLTDEEGKFITSYVIRQKLSDLLYTIEDKNDIYTKINNTSFEDYANTYLITNKNEKLDDFEYELSLHSISDYLELNNNYKIYHSVNDYLTNTNQLKKLKQYTKNKTILIDNGAHLGFLYRQEFLDSLNKTISEFKNNN